jgi:phosphoribosyl 1,2-cyclic phosphate phosphodiesterase
MRVTLLGTGGSAGVPMIGGPDGMGDWGVCDPSEPRNRRTRASILIEGPEGVLLVDTPPEMRVQFLACGVRRIDSIVYTHAHADHITGLDDVRILNRIVDRPIEAYAAGVTLDELEARFGYAFQPWQPPGFFRPVLLRRQVRPGEAFMAAGLRVTTFDQDHGFSRSLGLRIGDFAYSTDVVDLPDTSLAMLADLDTWVVDCFQQTPHRTHAWLDVVLTWVTRLRPRRTVLTHMGPDMDWAWLCNNLPAGIEPGFDGQVIELAG